MRNPLHVCCPQRSAPPTAGRRSRAQKHSALALFRGEKAAETNARRASRKVGENDEEGDEDEWHRRAVCVCGSGGPQPGSCKEQMETGEQGCLSKHYVCKGACGCGA